MSESKSSARSGGISFLGLLTVLFITLKLTGTIAWSWVWVLAPLWIPFIVSMCFLGGMVVLAIIAAR